MSTAKDDVLQAMLDEINNLQQAYDAAKTLPDRVFEAIYSKLTHHDIGRHNIAAPIKEIPTIESDESEDEDNYMGKRGILFHIIKSEGRAIAKREILKRYKEQAPQDKAPERSVTFALTGLKNNEAIRSYNPSSTGNIKAGFWTLSAWWDGDKLPDERKPFSNRLNLKYG